MLRTLLRRFCWLLLSLIVLGIALVLVFRWVTPPGTALMVERKIQAYQAQQEYSIAHQWLSWERLPEDLKMAVIAGEDQKFAEHKGFDIPAIKAALEHNSEGGTVRGASTISQQVAKNLFLWSDLSWPRKALEVWFTLWIEGLWPKERILEVYLNSAEWGEGIFGAEAAAQHHFGLGASYLSTQQAAQLAAVLPNPHAWNPAKPNAYISRRATWIRQQMRQLGGSHYLTQLQWTAPEWWPEFLR